MTGDSQRTRIIIIELSENDTTDLPTLMRALTEGRQPAMVVVEGGFTMGDTYNVDGQAGAVGPHAKASDNTFIQLRMPDGSPVDLPGLAAQLEQLRLALKSEAVTLEHDTAVGAVAQAEVAARQGDESGALAHLKAAGAWALGIARRIGVEVAALAIAHAIAGG
ncbi:hypothetical protein ACIRS1_06840 [Kitasatospora sp. NPDC101176]|uniref:hypothetical protein n=1 Tax=Kitasatospora sp. NPDC101176 TaxID=3364099 RepID=UPI003808C1E9